MYNRYIPQADGSYRRNRIQEIVQEAEQKTAPCPPAAAPGKEPQHTPCNNCMHNPVPRRPAPLREPCRRECTGIGSFLRQLLPKDFDIEDLLVILLLLLMAGDCQEDQNTALLTLALYLFL